MIGSVILVVFELTNLLQPSGISARSDKLGLDMLIFLQLQIALILSFPNGFHGITFRSGLQNCYAKMF